MAWLCGISLQVSLIDFRQRLWGWFYRERFQEAAFSAAIGLDSPPFGNVLCLEEPVLFKVCRFDRDPFRWSEICFKDGHVLLQ